LYFHGGLQRGTNNTRQIDGNIDRLLDNAQERGAYLYAPQTLGFWTDSVTLSTIMNAIDALKGTDSNVKLKRIYVTDISITEPKT
jgi:predicted peptidase